MDMGIVRGAKIEKVRDAPLDDPVPVEFLLRLRTYGWKCD